ncbi:MAG: hypothetical protein JO331_09640 [Verrucomicrobia bacterium]|nr:hypothetical protein [Verrucomicrobiota bacterium]
MANAGQSTDRNVFVNCPIDSEYKDKLDALIFTIYDCGFFPRYAEEAADSGEIRFDKICRLIRESKYSIHDLSRIEINSPNLPRFNMPFELGLFIGSKVFSKQKHKACLVMESEPYRYKQFCSDISGVDISAHGNDPTKVIRVVRDWLRSKLARSDSIPGGDELLARYRRFLLKFPELCRTQHLNPAEPIIYYDYISLVEGWCEGDDWRLPRTS